MRIRRPRSRAHAGGRHPRGACAAWAILLAGVSLAGCAKSTAPRGWLPRPVDAQKVAHGGWITLQRGDSRGTFHHGELLAVHADSVFVLEDVCVGFPRSQVVKATLMGYGPNTGPLTAWTVFGTLSTVSHGVYLILSAPVWILVGSSATVSQSRAPQMNLMPATWDAARAYARFPQGLPEGLDRSSLRMKGATR